MKLLRKQSLMIVWMMLCLLVSGCHGMSADLDYTQNKCEFLVENCVVTTDWYECEYPEAMMDVVRITEGEDKFDGNLEFYALLMDGAVPIFDLVYNSDHGDWVIEYEKDDGKKIPISFVMYAIPDNLSESDEMTFMAAQEVVNDIVGTLCLK